MSYGSIVVRALPTSRPPRALKAHLPVCLGPDVEDTEDSDLDDTEDTDDEEDFLSDADEDIVELQDTDPIAAPSTAAAPPAIRTMNIFELIQNRYGTAI